MRYRVWYEVIEDGDVGLILEKITYIELDIGNGNVMPHLIDELHQSEPNALLVQYVIDDEDDLIDSIAEYFC